MSDSGGKRHHYVPKHYLKRFADQKGRVAAYRRTTGARFTMSIDNAAVESGFYTVLDADGEESNALEDTLSEMEGQLAPALDRLVAEWPPDPETRGLIANFVALQAVRTRRQRDETEALASAVTETLRSVMGDQDGMYLGGEFVPKDVIEAPVEIDSYKAAEMMLKLAAGLVEPFMERAWSLHESKKRTIVTSDHPVSIMDTEASKLTGVGLSNAGMVIVPIDSRHVLLMQLDGGPDAPNILPLTPRMARDASSWIAGTSYEWTFADPRSTTLDDIELPVGAAPLATISGFGSNTARTLWGPKHQPSP